MVRDAVESNSEDNALMLLNCFLIRKYPPMAVSSLLKVVLKKIDLICLIFFLGPPWSSVISVSYFNTL